MIRGLIAAANSFVRAAPSTLSFIPGGSNIEYSLSNRKIKSTSTWQVVVVNSVLPSSGKVYLEFAVDGPTGSAGPLIGIMQGSSQVSGALLGALPDNSSASVGISTTRASGDGWSVALAGHTVTPAHTIGVAVDVTAGVVHWYSDGALQSQSEVSLPAGAVGLYFAVGSHPLYGAVEVLTYSSNTPSGYNYI